MSTATDRPDRPVAGVLYKVAATLAFAVMIVCVKMGGARVSTAEVVFFRSAFAILPILVMVVAMGQLGSLRTAHPIGHLWRSVFGLASMLLWFGAMQRLPMADAVAIAYAGPLIQLVLAVVMLGETVRVFRWTATMFGFLGVVVMLAPHLSVENLMNDRESIGAMMSFFSAFLTALAMMYVRSLTKTETTGAIALYFSIGGSLLSGLVMLFTYVGPTLQEAAWLAGAGVFGGIGQIFMTQAYRHADASVIAPIEYLSMVWAVLFGFWLFGEVPAWTVWIGGAMVVGSGIAIALRERHLQVRRAPPLP